MNKHNQDGTDRVKIHSEEMKGVLLINLACHEEPRVEKLLGLIWQTDKPELSAVTNAALASDVLSPDAANPVNLS